MAHMGELKPPVLVIPNSLRTERVAKCMSIEIEYLQEDVVGDVVDCHGSGRGIVRIKTSFGGNMKLVRRESRLVGHTVVEGIPWGQLW